MTERIKDTILGIRISHPMKDWLKKIAKKEKRSVSSQVVYLIEKEMKK